MKIVYFLISFILCSAQEWKTLESAHVVLEYPVEMQTTAEKLMQQSETLLPRLSKISNYPLKSFKQKKVKIYLTDAPDITNGFAIGNVVTIYGRSSHFLQRWTSNVDWYQRVLAHELVHHVMFRKTQRTPPLFGLGVAYGLGRPPRWFSEGLAQYYSESWDYFRGDYRLKTALLAGTFTYSRMQRDIGFAYPAGHAFVRYLAEKYGDEKLSELMEYKPNSWVYDFNAAFNDTYGKSAFELFRTFQKELVIYYGDKLSQIPARNDSVNMFFHGFHTSQILPFNTSDSTFIVSSQLSSDDRYLTTYKFDAHEDSKSRFKLITEKASTGMVLSENDKQVAYGKASSYTERNEMFLRFDWYVYDLETETNKLVAKNLRSRYGAFHKEKLILSAVEHDKSHLIEINIKTLEQKILHTSNFAIGKVITDGTRIIFESQNSDEKRGLYALEKSEKIELVNSDYDERNPLIINDSTLMYNVIEDDRFAVHSRFGANSHRIIYDQKDYLVEAYNKTEKAVLFSIRNDLGKKRYISIPIDSLKGNLPKISFRKSSYSGWKTKTTENALLISIPDSTVNYKRENVKLPQFGLQNFVSMLFPMYRASNWGVGFTTTWAEPLSRHYVSVNGVITSEWKKSILVAKHHLKTNNLSINTLYYHAPSVFDYDKDDTSLTYSLFDINISKNLKLFNDDWLNLFPYVGFNRARFDKENQSTDFYAYQLGLKLAYEKPSRHKSIVPQELYKIDMKYVKPFKGSEEFSIFRAKGTVGSNLLLRNISLVNNFSFTQNFNNNSINAFIGIDEYYDINTRREIGFTESVRGFNKNIRSNIIRWNSTNLNILLTKRTPFKALFIPINNIALTLFYDYASLENTEIWSKGAEVSFGEILHRVSVGYAKSNMKNNLFERENYYLRLTVNL